MIVDGLVSIASDGPYDLTIRRLDRALSEHAITPMLRWDHAEAAAQVDLQLRPLLLVVFGDPRVGTTLMQANPTAGIDLPLKLLVWETDNGEVLVGYNDPAWIRSRHGIGAPRNGSHGMADLLQWLAMRAAGQA